MKIGNYRLTPLGLGKKHRRQMSSQVLLVRGGGGGCLSIFKPKFWAVFSDEPHQKNRALAPKIIPKWKQKGVFDVKDVKFSCKPNSVIESNTDPTLMLCFAENGQVPQALAIWDQLLNSSSVPCIQTVSKLFDALSKRGHFAQLSQILSQLSSRKLDILPKAYSLAISCFGNGGQLHLMETTVREMASKGLWVDSPTANAFLRYYSIHGSLTEMEAAYNRLKRSQYSIDKEGIRAVSLAYFKQRKLHRVGEFLREVGLGRKDVGNLLWNLLLLSYAANFKMKTLQREFLKMIDSGFRPDLTTFNLRAMAFSRMSLLWDLHLSLQHMKHEMVVPDIVTYGCVVDAYLDRRLGRNLDFALNPVIMNLDDSPLVMTDPLVFEVLGKGDFHSSSEAFLEFSTHNKWTYRKLIALYKKKQYRMDQIFWNY